MHLLYYVRCIRMSFTSSLLRKHLNLTSFETRSSKYFLIKIKLGQNFTMRKFGMQLFSLKTWRIFSATYLVQVSLFVSLNGARKKLFIEVCENYHIEIKYCQNILWKKKKNQLYRTLKHYPYNPQIKMRFTKQFS